MKKEVVVNIDNILDDYESNLSNELQLKLDDYIKELRDMNNDQLPHYGEELMSSIFTMQQQVADKQAKLARYIKSQQNIIKLNFFIKQDKVIEEYTFITFEIKKLIFIMERYKKELSVLEIEFKLKLIALKVHLKEHGNFINKHEDINEGISSKNHGMNKQYQMMINIFSTHYLHLKDFDKTIGEYEDLYELYTTFGKICCIDCNHAPNVLSKALFIRGILKHKLYFHPLLGIDNKFINRKLEILPIKYFCDIADIKEISPIILDENMLRKFTIWLMTEQVSSLKPPEFVFKKMESDIIETLIDIDTMSLEKEINNSKSSFLNMDFKDSKKLIDEIANPYATFKNYINFEDIIKMTYAESILNLMKKNKIVNLFNNPKTCEVLRIIIKIINYKDYKIELRDLINTTRDYVLMLEQNKLEDLNNESIMYIKELSSGYAYSYNFDDAIDDDKLKFWLLEMAFVNCSNEFFSGFTEYGSSRYKFNYINQVSSDLSTEEDKFNFDFELNEEMIPRLFMVFMAGFLVEQNHKRYFNEFNCQFFEFLFDEVSFIGRTNNMHNFKEPELKKYFFNMNTIQSIYYCDPTLKLIYHHECDDEYSIRFRKAHYEEDVKEKKEEVKQGNSKDFTLQELHQKMQRIFNDIVDYHTKGKERIFIKRCANKTN